jgi:hypothetical protein
MPRGSTGATICEPIIQRSAVTKPIITASAPKQAETSVDGLRLLFVDGPLEDELLSSWITRLARGNRVKNHTLSNSLFPGVQIWNRDVDWSASAGITEVLAAETGIAPERASATCLKHFEGHLFDHHRPNARTQWVRPVGVWHRRRLAPGLQFCPRCLQEDGEKPYFRRMWRLGLVAVCVRHGCILKERCPSCGEPASPHRTPIEGVICACWRCGFDFRNTDAPAAAPDALAFQCHLERALLNGGAPLGAYGWVYSLSLFRILHQIMRLVAVGRAAPALRRAIAEREGIDVVEVPKIGGRDVERLTPSARHDLLRAAAVLLADWPNSFVKICEAEHVWSATILRDLECRHEIPFALLDPVDAQLDRTFYRPNRSEIDAVRRVLRRQEGRATRNAIRRLIGRDSHLF